jgi:broad specificity phosphatase PhoE
MELYLVRHAESFNNRLIDDLRASNEIGRWPSLRQTDPDLTARGIEQANALSSGFLYVISFLF